MVAIIKMINKIGLPILKCVNNTVTLKYNSMCIWVQQWKNKLKVHVCFIPYNTPLNSDFLVSNICTK